MIPDRLPEALREPIKRFPPGALQFEVGIQTFNDDVSQRISRRQDNAKLAENLRFLRERDRRARPRRPDRRPARRGPRELRGAGSTGSWRCGRRRSRSASSSGCAARRSCGTTRSGAWSTARTRRTRCCRRRDVDFADDAADAAVQPVLGPGRQQRQLRRDDAADLGRRRRRSTAFLRLTDRLHAHFGKGHGIALQHLAEFLFRHLDGRAGPDCRRRRRRDVARLPARRAVRLPGVPARPRPRTRTPRPPGGVVRPCRRRRSAGKAGAPRAPMNPTAAESLSTCGRSKGSIVIRP